MEVLLIFVLISVFGYLFSSLIIKKISIIERFGLSYLLGLGLTTLFMFFYSWIGIKITRQSILLMLIVLVTLCLIIISFLKIKNDDDGILGFISNFKGLKLYEKVVCLIIFCIFILSYIFTVYYPVYVWDALALYDFAAKIIAQFGFIVQIAKQFFYFAQYPLLVSLGHTIVYLFGGTNPQFIYSSYFIVFIAIFYSMVLKKSNRTIALLASLLLTTSPLLFGHSVIAYTNLPYTVFYTLGTIYLFISLSESKFNYLFMSSLLIGLSTWARGVEPMWMTEMFVVILYSFYKKNLYPILIFIPVFFAIQLPWRIFQTQLYGDIYSSVGQLSLISKILTDGIDFQRAIEVFMYLYRNVIQSWGPIVIIFVFAILVDFKKRFSNKSLIMLLIILLNFMVLFIGTYLFSMRFSNEWKLIPDSAVRMSMFFPPLIIYYIGIVLGKILNVKK